MIHTFLFSALLICSSVAVWGSPFTAPYLHASVTPYDTKANSLFWKLTAPNGAVSHVFGTMHLRDSSILYQRDTVLMTLRNSRVLYAELDLDSMLTSFDPMMGMLPAGQTIETLYSPEDLKLIRTELERKLGPMAKIAERMRPPMIVAMLMMEELESTAPYGIDEYLWGFAKRAQVIRRGMEETSEQIKVLLSMPNEVLPAVLREERSSDSLMTLLVKAYASENLSEIALYGKQLEEWPEFERSMNADRNKVMIDRISRELVRGNVFIAVGALHLPGEKGLLRVLEEKGFTVEPVLGGVRSSWMPPTERTDTPPQRR